MTNDNYTKITWPEVRKGDVLMHENGDRLTVDAASTADYDGYQTCKVAGMWHSVSLYRDAGFSPYRRKPEMPTQPGAFHDKDGDVVVLTGRNGLYPWRDLTGPRMASEMEPRAPFTRLVPMPSSDAVREVVKGIIPLSRYETVTAAVMALLEAGQNGEGDDD